MSDGQEVTARNNGGRGYLEDGDLPTWISCSSATIIKSHYKMLSAWLRRFREKGPFHPIGQLKHSVNQMYNKSKWGVDMCTENFNKIMHPVSMPFESKYLLRMIYGVVANVWKVQQGRLVKKMVLEYREKHGGNNPSVSSVRNKCYELPLEQFVYDLSIQWLRNLEMERNRMMSGGGLAAAFQRQRQRLISPQRNTVASDAANVQRALDRRKRDRRTKWPISRNRTKKFNEEADLKMIRTFSNAHFCHVVTNLTQSKTCALCSSASSQRAIRTACSKCEVALCTKTRSPHDTSCWTAWHQENTDLEAEHRSRSSALKSKRGEDKEGNKSKHAARMAVARRRKRKESSAEAEEDDNVAEAKNGNDNAAAAAAAAAMDDILMDDDRETTSTTPKRRRTAGSSPKESIVV